VELLQHGPSVIIVAVDGDEVVVVRQSRPGADGRTVELPSGKMENGETPEEAAMRELAEECGLAASRLRRIGGFWAAPGYSTEYVHVIEGTEITLLEASTPDPDEDIEVERRRLADAPAGLSEASSIAALALWHAKA
jgi:ADP-ribose pyrophosphatase